MRHGGRRTVEPSAGTKRQKAKERPSLARWKRRARVAANAVAVGRARRCRWGVICCHRPPGSSAAAPASGSSAAEPSLGSSQPASGSSTAEPAFRVLRLRGPSATAPASGVVRHVAVKACLRVAAGQPPDLAVGEGVMVIVPVGSGEEGSRGRRLWKDEREPWSPPRRLWKGNGWCDRV
uniref:Uncharacterized protein n=1 Tax=Oryza barthii TaxID=65489 RepID=A0A0D3HTR8_9ORYZ